MQDRIFKITVLTSLGIFLPCFRIARQGRGCPKFLAGNVFGQISTLLENSSPICRQHEMLSLPSFGHFPARKMAAGKSAPPSGMLLDFLLWDRHSHLEFFWEEVSPFIPAWYHSTENVYLPDHYFRNEKAAQKVSFGAGNPVDVHADIPADVRGQKLRSSPPNPGKKQEIRCGYPWPEGADVRAPKGPKIEKFQDLRPGLKFSSEIENFKRATHQTPIFCGEFWRSRLKMSSEIEFFERARLKISSEIEFFNLWPLRVGFKNCKVGEECRQFWAWILGVIFLGGPDTLEKQGQKIREEILPLKFAEKIAGNSPIVERCPSTVLRVALYRAFIYKDNETVLGTNPNRTHDQSKPYLKIIETVLDLYSDKGMSPFLLRGAHKKNSLEIDTFPFSNRARNCTRTAADIICRTKIKNHPTSALCRTLGINIRCTQRGSYSAKGVLLPSKHLLLGPHNSWSLAIEAFLTQFWRISDAFWTFLFSQQNKTHSDAFLTHFWRILAIADAFSENNFWTIPNSFLAHFCSKNGPQKCTKLWCNLCLFLIPWNLLHFPAPRRKKKEVIFLLKLAPNFGRWKTFKICWKLPVKYF